MRLDYDGVGGVGIRVTNDHIQTMIDKGLFSREEFEEDQSNCMDSLGIPYSCAGSFYQENASYFYFLVKGEILDDVIENKHEFIKSLSYIGINITDSDLIIISDLMIW